MPQQPYNPSLHRLAIATAIATFPLIFMGGLVTSHQAGMSVPDWPNTFGYNMFLFPPNLWIGGIFYEHTHRLAGCAVGFLSIMLVLFSFGAGRNASVRRHLLRWTLIAIALSITSAIIGLLSPAESLVRNTSPHAVVGLLSIALILTIAFFARTHEPRRWVRWLTVAVLLSVIAQGLLGGLRVVLVQLDLAIIHGCTAQAFFCLTGFLIAVTSRWWHSAAPEPSSPASSNQKSKIKNQKLITLALTTTLFIYLQTTLGAVMRHYQAGLAIPDLPLAYGHILPPATSAGLKSINTDRVWNLNLDPVTLPQIWLHFSHRLGALLVTALIITLVIHILRRHRTQPLLTRPAWTLCILLTIQFTLGVLTVLWQKPADIASYHVAFGALTLITSFLITVRSLRISSPERATVNSQGRKPLDSAPSTISSPERACPEQREGATLITPAPSGLRLHNDEPLQGLSPLAIHLRPLGAQRSHQ